MNHDGKSPAPGVTLMPKQYALMSAFSLVLRPAVGSVFRVARGRTHSW